MCTSLPKVEILAMTANNYSAALTRDRFNLSWEITKIALNHYHTNILLWTTGLIGKMKDHLTKYISLFTIYLFAFSSTPAIILSSIFFTILNKALPMNRIGLDIKML